MPQTNPTFDTSDALALVLHALIFSTQGPEEACDVLLALAAMIGVATNDQAGVAQRLAGVAEHLLGGGFDHLPIAAVLAENVT